MASDFIPLEEAAELEGVNYKTLAKRLERSPQKYETKTEPSENGGKDRVLISVSSLSPQARKKHQLRKTVKATPEDKIPWYVYVDYNWYKEKYPAYLSAGAEKSDYIRRYLSGELGMSAGQFKEFMSEKYNTSQKTIQRAVSAYSEAIIWARNKELETGQNHDYYKIMALSREPREDCTFKSLTDEMKAYIENIYYDETFALNMNPVTNLHADLRELAAEKGWDNLPSYDTVLRYTNYLDEKDGKGARDLASKGKRYWKNKHMMKRFSDRHVMQVLEEIQGDGHTFDCWVSVRRANGKLQAIRPVLAAWIDARSRALVGWVICEDSNAQIIKQSLLNVIYPKKNTALPYGLPKGILIDNGKDYTAKELTGVQRSIRSCFDEDAEGVIKSLGILEIRRALPYQAWVKGIMERFFGTVNTSFTKRLKSYTGTLTGKYTESKINKDIKKMLENGELMTIEEFSQLFENWVTATYHKRNHEGLKDQGEEYTTPIEVFNNADKYFKAAPPMEYAISLLMKGESRVVTSSGIQWTVGGKKLWYTHVDLMQHKGKKVTMKYFPDDITKIMVYDEHEKKICEAVSYELLHIAPKLSEDALIEHLKDGKRQLRKDSDIVKKRRLTFEERQELNLEDAGKKVVKPELSEESSSVVSLPKSKRYKEDKKTKRNEQPVDAEPKKSSRNLKAEYLRRNADEAFSSLG